MTSSLLRARLFACSAVLFTLTAGNAALAQLTAQPTYPQLAPFCPVPANAVPGSQQILIMESADPRQLFMLPRDGSAPRFLIIGDGRLEDIHVPLLKDCSRNGIPAAVYRGTGQPAYNADLAQLGRSCANRQSLIVNYEAVRWFAQQYPECQILEVGSRGPGETVPATSTGVNWTGMERATLARCGMRTANPTWPGMEWGARPPTTYVPIGPRPPVGPPTETWPGMEWGAPRPSTYMPSPAPASCAPPGGGGVTLYCGLPPPRIPNWARPNGPMQGDMMFSGAMGMGTFGPVAFGGGALTVDGFQRCHYGDPSGIVEAGGGTLLFTTAGSATLYSGGAFLTGAGYWTAGGYVTAGGTALGSVALPATACVATAAAGYYTGRAIDDASGGRISDGAAVGICAVGDTCANVLWRWWMPGCEWNYDLTRTSASMFGESARCNMRGPAPVCGGGRVQAGGVDPPYDPAEEAEPPEVMAASMACAASPSPGSSRSTWLVPLLAIAGVLAGIRRRRSRAASESGRGAVSRRGPDGEKDA
ncbi:MAG: hypothetical protein R3B70_32990 [Polyangiaceae bacterium]